LKKQKEALRKQKRKGRWLRNKMEKKKNMTVREMDKKIIDLKIELLKNPTKRKNIKKEIAKLLTMAREQSVPIRGKNKTKLSGESD